MRRPSTRFDNALETHQVSAVIVVLIVLVVAFGGVAFDQLSRPKITLTFLTATTVTLSSSSGPPIVTEEIIYQPVITDEVCLPSRFNASVTTAYLGPSPFIHITGNQTAAVTTTEVVWAISTSTVYANMTEFSVNNSTTVNVCTEFNSHFNITETCPPCV